MLEIPHLDIFTHGDKTIVAFSCTKEYFDEAIKPNDGKEISIYGKVCKQIESQRSGRPGVCYNPSPYRLASMVIEEVINHSYTGE